MVLHHWNYRFVFDTGCSLRIALCRFIIILSKKENVTMKTLSLVFQKYFGVMLLSALLGIVIFLAAPGSIQKAQAKPQLATRSFTIKNNCGYTIYPGIYPASTYSNGGWTMAAGAQVSFTVPDGNIGRLWGRIGCNGASPAVCTTGSCGGTGLQCAGTTGFPNTALFEWNLNAGGTDWYDVSYVDAIDSPIGVQVSNGSCVSPNTCSNSVLTNCPADLKSGSVCLSPCTKYNTDQYCCRGAYGTQATCIVSQWAASAQTYVNNVHNYCPHEYAYAYDEGSGALQTCATGSNYTITFCPAGGAPAPTPTRTNTPVAGATPTRTPTPGGGGTGVTFYQDANYAGAASGVKAVGDYPSLPGDIPNDWMSSLRVPAGWTVLAYDNGGFGGAVCTFTADTSYVGSTCNDKMSSFKIQQGGGGGSSNGVDNVSSNQARPWYKCAITCSYVIVHYIVAGQAQQNVNATYNSGLARWEYLITGITAGQVLQYQFTYNDGTQHDTAWFNWTKP
jgi:hypothetical protein